MQVAGCEVRWRRALPALVLALSVASATAAMAQRGPVGETADADRLRQVEAALAEQKKLTEQLQQHVIQQGNWIGQLLYRTQDMVDRPKWEAEARLLAPEFTPQELALLNRWEIRTDPFVFEATPVPFVTQPSAGMTRPRLAAADGAQHRYMLLERSNDPLTAGRRDVTIDAGLPRPRLRLDQADTMHPVTSVETAFEPGPPAKVNYVFEFDTSPMFDSPNIWRYPNLVPFLDQHDLTGVRGLQYHQLRTTLTDHQAGPSVRFPFRITAMSRPRISDATFEDLVKEARLLQHGLSRADAIAEVFNFGRHKWIWGGNALEFSALDTYRAGIAGCGHLNELIGAMLELNGIRYRMVSGFHPIFRVWNPGGGHSAIEVHDGARWSFLDVFLGIHLPGVSAKDFAVSPEGLRPAASIDAPAFRDPAATLQRLLGAQLSLRDLFKYRKYADKSMRLPVAYQMQLRAAEARRTSGLTEHTYGLTWPLRTSDVTFDPARDLPETQTIHVRARYVVSTCEIRPVTERPCIDPDATASEWATTSFTIRPRELLRAAVGKP